MKKLKFLLPLLAFVMAIGLAFGIEDNTVSQTGYYEHPTLGVQPVPGGVDCLTTGTISCKYGIYDVFADESLMIPLYKRSK